MAGFFKKLINKITNTAEIDWDDLEAELITGDLGVKLSLEIVSELQGLGRKVSAMMLWRRPGQNSPRSSPKTHPPCNPAPMANPPSF